MVCEVLYNVDRTCDPSPLLYYIWHISMLKLYTVDAYVSFILLGDNSLIS